MGRKKGAAGGAKSVAVPVPQTEVEVEKEVKKAAPRKRNPCPGIRAVGGRIYDPENGKTCHQVSAILDLQSSRGSLCWGADLIDPLLLFSISRLQCRQKTTDFAVACKKPGEKGPCSIHFCHTCLLNR